MRRLWTRFKDLNYRITVSGVNCLCVEEKDRPYCQLVPFAWLWMLIPICGIVIFQGEATPTNSTENKP